MSLLSRFIISWLVNSFGLWLALTLLGSGYISSDAISSSKVILTSGLVLSVINLLIRPIVSIISLPVTILTLGLFTIVINGLMVYLALSITKEIEITLSGAIIVGLVVGLVNYVVNDIMRVRKG